MSYLGTRLFGLWSRAYILLTLAAMCWAGNAIVARAARDLVPPMALSFWRWSLALLLILPFAWPHLRRDWARVTGAWRVLVPMGLLGIGVFNSLLYTGLQSTTALNALLIQSAQPLVILALGALLLREHIGRWQAAGLLLSLFGVVTILTRGQPDMILALRLNIGDAVIACALIAWGLYTVFLRKRPAVHPLSFLSATIAIGLLLIAPFYAAEIGAGKRIVAGRGAGLAILYVGIFPSVLAYSCFNRGVELLGSAQAGLFMNGMPIMGAGLAILFLGERLQGFHLMGLGLVLCGIILARRGAQLPVSAAAT